jgi:FdhD protein
MVASSRRPVWRFDADAAGVSKRPDTLAAEEPLEIRIGKRPLAVTMRTPGDELDLALGFLFTEGVIGAPDDVVTAILCGDDAFNVAEVTLAGHVAPPAFDRTFITSSSCGVCGKESIDAIRSRSRFDLRADDVAIKPEVLVELPDRLRAAQKTFAKTGGLHAAGIFTAGGDLIACREDVGRHNAVDKVIGWALRSGLLPLTGHVLQVSGRASFELTQKAWMAGIPVLSAVSAPSTLAVDLADEAGMTLAGFVRGRAFNAYAHPRRFGTGAS